MMKNEKNDQQSIEAGMKITIDAKTRQEATEKVNALRKQAEDKGLKANGGFVFYDYEKEDEGKNPFSATLKIIDPSNI